MEVDFTIDYTRLAQGLKVRCNSCEGTGNITKVRREKYIDAKGKKRFREIVETTPCAAWDCGGKGWYSEPESLVWAQSIKDALNFMNAPDTFPVHTIYRDYY